ncbi:hypothetical protein CCACVL1_24457 [Corchorus capsularis]|uniref:Uncharacterized protein n=1 Tax=Corchorus capsularis TaxID=210143 RepID=A0A1R3GPI4_COCAP|nr:hypothetical protein CCACVL1_24457 [Corchorus capsularis]
MEQLQLCVKSFICYEEMRLSFVRCDQDSLRLEMREAEHEFWMFNRVGKMSVKWHLSMARMRMMPIFPIS